MKTKQEVREKLVETINDQKFPNGKGEYLKGKYEALDWVLGSDFWIQKINMKKGLVHKYLYRKYGLKAFDNKGRIKMSYINKAYNHASPLWKKRLNLACNLKNIARKKSRKK